MYLYSNTGETVLFKNNTNILKTIQKNDINNIKKFLFIKKKRKCFFVFIQEKKRNKIEKEKNPFFPSFFCF